MRTGRAMTSRVSTSPAERIPGATNRALTSREVTKAGVTSPSSTNRAVTSHGATRAGATSRSSTSQNAPARAARRRSRRVARPIAVTNLPVLVRRSLQASPKPIGPTRQNPVARALRRLQASPTARRTRPVQLPLARQAAMPARCAKADDPLRSGRISHHNKERAVPMGRPCRVWICVCVAWQARAGLVSPWGLTSLCRFPVYLKLRLSLIWSQAQTTSCSCSSWLRSPPFMSGCSTLISFL